MLDQSIQCLSLLHETKGVPSRVESIPMGMGYAKNDQNIIIWIAL